MNDDRIPAIKQNLDLVGLVETYAGPAGRRVGGRVEFHCPHPAHDDGNPSFVVTVTGTAAGTWRCWSQCDRHGDAIDLVQWLEGCSKAEAIERLAAKCGLARAEENRRSPSRPITRPSPSEGVRTQQRAPVMASNATPPHVTVVRPPRTAELETYVATCAASLWEPAGVEVLAYLRGRGFSDEVLRANRIGADPGTAELNRADDLPKPRGAAVVFPVIDGDRVTGLQVRPLRDGKPKYLNPSGPCPRVAVLATPSSCATPDTVLVTEGMPDALTAATYGYRAVAVLGTVMPDADVADRIVAAFPTERLVLVFDGDVAGDTGANKLADLLVAAGAHGRVYRVQIPEYVADRPADRDLSEWATVAGDEGGGFDDELAVAIDEAAPFGWAPVEWAADLMAGFLDELANENVVAIPTGFVGLDRMLANGGWRPGLFLLGGMPGVGKSALALTFALRAAVAGTPVLYVSVEQGSKDLLGRIFCKELGLPISAYFNHDHEYLDGVRRVRGDLPLDRLALRGDPYLVTDTEGTVGRVRRWASEIAADTGRAPLVVVDYLQRLRPPDADRAMDVRVRVGMAGVGLRQLARDLDVPVLVVSSLSRANYAKALPTLDALKESGDLEYDADCVLMLRLEARSDEQAEALLDDPSGLLPVELHTLKNRFGGLTLDRPMLLEFNRKHGGFREKGTSPGSFDTPPSDRPPLRAVR